MIIKILIIIPIIYLMIKLYLINIIYIFDLVATILSRIISLFTKKRNKIVYKNLELVFGSRFSDNDKHKIMINSYKLLIINALISIHQRFFINNNYLLNFYSINFNTNFKNKKMIFVMMHYGIFYDFTTFFKINGKMICNFKMHNKFAQELIWNSNKFKNKIIGVNLGNLKFYFNENKHMYLLTDQKGSRYKEDILFLNNKCKFHDYPVNIHKVTNRSISIIYCHYQNYKIKMNVIPININNKTKKEIVQEIADNFTNIILKNPEQYMWAHNRFNLAI